MGLSLDYRQLIQAVNTTRTLKNRHNDLLLYLVQVRAVAHCYAHHSAHCKAHRIAHRIL